MPYDVVTFGETMLRLTPPHLYHLEQMTRLEVQVGGSESNVAAGLARLGMRAAWLSRLTDNALGQFIANTIRAHGVDISHVIWTESDRVGLYFLEEGKAPRGSRVIYDRVGSAMSRIQPQDIPDTLFQSSAQGTLHLSGITPALSASAAATTHHIVDLARAAGWHICFDLNYRQKLWTAEAAFAVYDRIAPLARWIFLPLRDAVTLYQTSALVEEALDTLHRRYPDTTIVLTLGANGSTGIDPDGTISQQAAIPAEPVGRVGGGDAFAAGFLYGYLRFNTLDAGLRWGNAAAAHKYSTPGDMPVFHRKDIELLLSQAGSSDLKR